MRKSMVKVENPRTSLRFIFIFTVYSRGDKEVQPVIDGPMPAGNSNMSVMHHQSQVQLHELPFQLRKSEERHGRLSLRSHCAE